MHCENPTILLLVCNNCAGMTGKLLPEIKMKYADNVRVLAVTCPSQIDPFAIMKLLKESVEGIIVACPQQTCCCPENKKVMKRREMVKDILPVFGLHKEQFQLASVSPFAGEELIKIIEQMLTFAKTLNHIDDYSAIYQEEEFTDACKWVN